MVITNEMLNIFLYVLFTLCGATSVSGLSTRLVPILLKANAEGHEDYITVNVTINRYGSLQNFSMDMDIMVLQPLSNIRMTTGYFVRLRNSDNWIYNKTFDFCEFLVRPIAIDRFSSLVFEELRLHGKVPRRCPIPPGRLLFTNNTLTNVRLPLFLPETNFGLTVKAFLSPSNTYVFRSSWYGRLKKVSL